MNEHTPTQAGPDPRPGEKPPESDWTQSPWFKTWLKLARNEPEAKPPAPPPPAP